MDFLSVKNILSSRPIDCPGIMLIKVCSYIDSWFQPGVKNKKIRHKYVAVRALILLDTPDFYVVFISKGLQVNMGSSYTLPSNILFLAKNLKPVHHRGTDPINPKALSLSPGGRAELEEIGVIDLASKFICNDWNISAGWYPIKIPECPICFDKQCSYIDTGCNKIHYVACSDCIARLSRCPTCNNDLQLTISAYPTD